MELKIIRRVTVQPAEATWSGSIRLSELENIGFTGHEGVAYFYQAPNPPMTLEAITDALVHSLSRALVHFYPLAGRLTLLAQGGGRLELLCNGKGALLVAAELSAEMNTTDFDDFIFPAIDKETIPIHEIPVLVAQVTKFKCGGIALCVATAHVLVDGVSRAMFMSGWSELARSGGTLSKVPLHDRTPFLSRDIATTPPMFDHSKDFGHKPDLLNQPDPQDMNEIETTFVTRLPLSSDQVERLKMMANEGGDKTSTRPYTRYESIAAHIWKCSSKVRKHEAEQPSACDIPIDLRRRMDPPLPVEYFGHGTLDLTAECLAGELQSKPMSFGASKIREAIDKVTSDYVRSAIQFVRREQDVNRFRHLYEKCTLNPNIMVSSWIHLPFGDCDFGWGKESHFRPISGRKDNVDGYNNVFSGPDGSLLVHICIVPHHIEEFRKYFYGDIVV